MALLLASRQVAASRQPPTPGSLVNPNLKNAHLVTKCRQSDETAPLLHASPVVVARLAAIMASQYALAAPSVASRFTVSITRLR